MNTKTAEHAEACIEARKQVLYSCFLFAVTALVIFLFASCNSTVQPENKLLAEKLDSLHAEVAELKSLLEEKKKTTDTLLALPQQKDSITDTRKTQPLQHVITQKPKVKQPQKPKLTLPDNDTTYHFYTNGALSVKITPWSEDSRNIYFYDGRGVQTFHLEDVRKSYSTTTSLKFHPNGAVSVAEIHDNPGASMYWYETEITFDTLNEPLVKYRRQMPPEHLDIEENLPWLWNKQKRQWVKQEIVKETSTPGGK